MLHFSERTKTRTKEIENAIQKLVQLKAIISWKTLVITKKFRLTQCGKEADNIAKDYKMMVHDDIDAKVKKLRNAKELSLIHI